MNELMFQAGVKGMSERSELIPCISIGNHMNSSAIWEIIALSHVLEGRVITRGEAEWNLSF